MVVVVDGVAVVVGMDIGSDDFDCRMEKTQQVYEN